MTHTLLPSTSYVLGFAFDPYRRVALILKRHPINQAGLWNGVGGAVDQSELPQNAMAREFYEETGVRILAQDWHCFGRMDARDAVIHLFTTCCKEVVLVKTQVETVQLFMLQNLPSGVVYDVPALIQLALLPPSRLSSANLVTK